jgi:hypothetical protein
MLLEALQYFQPTLKKDVLGFWVWVLCYDRRSVGPSVLVKKHPSGAYDQIFITVRQFRVCWCEALWRDDGSVVCNCCWLPPAQSFSDLSPVGLVTKLYCLRFETFSSPPSTRHVLGITNRPLCFDTTWTHRKRLVQQLYCCVAFVAAVTFLPSRCLARIGWFSPSRCLAMVRGYIYRCTKWWKGFMKYAVEIGSDVDIHTKFHKDWFSHSKVHTGWYINTQTAWKSHKPTFLILKSLKVGLRDHLAVCVSMCNPPYKLSNAWTNLYESRYVQYIYIYIGHWANPNGVFHKFPPSLVGNGSANTFLRQRIHATIEELLGASFSMRFVSYQRTACVCNPQSLLGNGSVNTVSQQLRILGSVVLYAVHVVWKESRRSVLPKTSYYLDFVVYLTTLTVVQTVRETWNVRVSSE